MPLGIMVSGIHGQFPPITLALGVGALVAARAGRAHWAGLLIGLSVTCANWSVLLVPGVLMAVWAGNARRPGTARRQCLAVLGWTAAVPGAFLVSSTVFLDTPVTGLVELAKAIMSTRPVVGDWGWTALATGGTMTVSPALGQIGMPVLLIGLLAAGWWWRKADPVALTAVLILVFLVVTYRLGAQYLMWPVPYLIARPPRFVWPAITAASAWAAAGYLHVETLLGMTWWQFHTFWSLSSLLVIALLVAALPSREAAAQVRGPLRRDPAPVAAGATDP
ncbi:hypothetical protein ACFQYP_14450 [Nonomuraea antimicrobica]